jgi:hypothetical protein
MEKDPIEDTQEYKDALKKIRPELDLLDKELEERKIVIGSCHIYWARKKDLLKMYGIDWKTPAECNPNVVFD